MWNNQIQGKISTKCSFQMMILPTIVLCRNFESLWNSLTMNNMFKVSFWLWLDTPSLKPIKRPLNGGVVTICATHNTHMPFGMPLAYFLLTDALFRSLFQFYASVSNQMSVWLMKVSLSFQKRWSITLNNLKEVSITLSHKSMMVWINNHLKTIFF